jgi:uncharacterized membrane protein
MFDNQNILELELTAAGLLLGIALVAAMVWLERQPRKSLEPRLLPTTPFMFLGAFVCLIAVVHFANLFGIHTGR